MVEGGATLFSSFLQNNLIDELHLFISPMVLGRGIGTFYDFSTSELFEAPTFKFRAISKSGNDIYSIATFNEY